MCSVITRSWIPPPLGATSALCNRVDSRAVSSLSKITIWLIECLWGAGGGSVRDKILLRPAQISCDDRPEKEKTARSFPWEQLLDLTVNKKKTWYVWSMRILTMCHVIRTHFMYLALFKALKETFHNPKGKKNLHQKLNSVQQWATLCSSATKNQPSQPYLDHYHANKGKDEDILPTFGRTVQQTASLCVVSTACKVTVTYSGTVHGRSRWHFKEFDNFSIGGGEKNIPGVQIQRFLS